MKRIKRILAVMLAVLMVTSILPDSSISTTAASKSKSATVSTQSKLDSNLKKSSITKLTVKTGKKKTFSTKSKNYRKKTLYINGANTKFKNSAMFKSVNIQNVSYYIENAKGGNTLNVSDSRATIEVTKTAKKTKINMNKKNASITVKDNGAISYINLKQVAVLNVSGKPKASLPVTNNASGSKIGINVKANTNVTLNKNATVTIGANVTGATITLAAGVTATINNNSSVDIVVKKSGSSDVIVPKGTSSTITADGTDPQQSTTATTETPKDEKKPDTPIPSFTVKFDTNGGSAVENQTVEQGKKVLQPADPTWDGFTFKGWYYDDSLKHAYNFDTAVNADITLYAKWKANTDSDTKHTVTFVRNDGSDGAYEMEYIVNNHRATRPAVNPTRQGYAFTGWYDDASLANEYDFSEPVTGDITIYAGWGNPEGGDGLYDTEEGGDTVYSVTDIRVSNDTVKATINTNSSAILVVGFYSEEGYFEEGSTWSTDTAENYGNLAVQTPSYCESARISLERNADFDLPEHYIVVGSLYDSESLELMCDKYVCIDYTEENERFEAQTINDFQGQNVINFDSDETDNFGVLADGVKEINCTYTTNTLSVSSEEVTTASGNTAEKNTFTISNPTDTVSSLVAGDRIVIYELGTAKYLVKIGSVGRDSSGNVVITESIDVSMTDFYTVLKVDMAEADQSEEVSEDLDTMATVIDVDTSLASSIATNLTWNINTHASLSGEIKGTVKLGIHIRYDAKLFRKDYFECSVTSDINATVTVTLEGKLDNSEKLKKALEGDADHPGAKVKFATPILGLDAYWAVTMPTELSFKGGVSVTFKYNTQTGYEYNSNSGVEKIAKKSISADFKGEAAFELKTGPKFQIGVVFLKDVIDTSLGVQVGVDITATLTITQDDELSTGESKHACYTCLSGEAKWFATADIALNYKIIKDKLEGQAFDITLFNFEAKLNQTGPVPGAFFWSILNAQDSIYGGNRHFGWGNCENVKYRTTVETYDDSGNKTTGVGVTITKNNGDVAKSGKSDLNTYLYPGTYTASATFDGTAVSKSFVIDKAKKTVQLSKNSTSTSEVKGNVRDSSTQNWISGATLVFQKSDDLVIASATSGSDGSFSVNLPADSYEVKVSKDGYVSVTTNVTVEENETKYMEIIDLVPGDDEGKGGFSGYLTDALTGKAVSGVSLEVRKGANSPDTNDILLELTTNSSGYYEYNPTTFFGINRGLENGQYTITAKKSGYITTSFNIVVREDELVSGQNATISPVLDDDEFRVVLRWGSSPSDLDSHYNAIGISDHIYYSNQNGSTANLDVDDTSSYGPETVTVTAFDATNGFVYSVHDYTNKSSSSSKALSNSGAYVTVYHGDYSPVIFYVPVGYTGTVWNVFRVNSAGQIEALNTFENISSPSNVGSALAN